MKKKLISLISAALCLCMVLSACGGRPTAIRPPPHPAAKAETTPKTKRLPSQP